MSSPPLYPIVANPLLSCALPLCLPQNYEAYDVASSKLLRNISDQDSSSSVDDDNNDEEDSSVYISVSISAHSQSAVLKSNGNLGALFMFHSTILEAVIRVIDRTIDKNIDRIIDKETTTTNATQSTTTTQTRNNSSTSSSRLLRNYGSTIPSLSPLLTRATVLLDKVLINLEKVRGERRGESEASRRRRRRNLEQASCEGAK